MRHKMTAGQTYQIQNPVYQLMIRAKTGGVSITFDNAQPEEVDNSRSIFVAPIGRPWQVVTISCKDGFSSGRDGFLGCDIWYTGRDDERLPSLEDQATSFEILEDIVGVSLRPNVGWFANLRSLTVNDADQLNSPNRAKLYCYFVENLGPDSILLSDENPTAANSLEVRSGESVEIRMNGSLYACTVNGVPNQASPADTRVMRWRVYQ